MLMNPIHVIKRCHKKIIEYKSKIGEGLCKIEKQ